MADKANKGNKENDKDNKKGGKDVAPPPPKQENLKDISLPESPQIRPKQERSCIHHQQKLVYYCESCEEPVCEQCTVLGPHNNQLHRINTLTEAFKARVIAMHQVIAGSLVAKRDQLIAQVHRIDHRLEEVKHVKALIERDIRGEFGGILERLRSAEGVKLAVLQHEIANLQRDIDKINDIVNVVNELTGDRVDPIDFLLRCRHLTETIEFTVAKPFKTTIEVVPYDLPRELAEQREKLEKMRVVQEILEMKDLVIFELINKFNEEEEKIAANLNKTAQEEISEWAKLTDKFAMELRKYHNICFYCACVMDDKNINKFCEINSRTQLPDGFGYTIDAPDRSWHNTRRHFFAKPKPEFVKSGKITKSGVTDYYTGYATKSVSADERLYKTQYQMFLEVLLAKVRKYCHEQKIEIEKLFTEHDKSATGFINHITFTFILHEFCNVDPIEIDKLKLILDPDNKDKISYVDLVKMINDPSYLVYFQERK